MSEKTTWERFFDAHAPVYEENNFTKDTLREVDFLLEELALPAGSSILDVGCGTGRHSIELAKRGYAVTGIDISSAMLRKAQENARAAAVNIEWIQANATRFMLSRPFDAAICLCEGAFGLLDQADDPIAQPLSILCNISRCLKPQAKAILNVLNGTAMLRKYKNADVAEGRFNPLLMVESYTYPPRRDLPAVPVQERGFMPSDLLLFSRLAGLTLLHLWGGTAGNWGRRALDLDEIEILIVTRKTTEPVPGLALCLSQPV